MQGIADPRQASSPVDDLLSRFFSELTELRTPAETLGISPHQSVSPFQIVHLPPVDVPSRVVVWNRCRVPLLTTRWKGWKASPLRRPPDDSQP